MESMKAQINWIAYLRSLRAVGRATAIVLDPGQCTIMSKFVGIVTIVLYIVLS